MIAGGYPPPYPGTKSSNLIDEGGFEAESGLRLSILNRIFYFPLFQFAYFVPSICKWVFPKYDCEQHHSDFAHFLISGAAHVTVMLHTVICGENPFINNGYKISKFK